MKYLSKCIRLFNRCVWYYIVWCCNNEVSFLSNHPFLTSCMLKILQPTSEYWV